MNVLNDKFSFTEEFVFIDSKQQSAVDWDELDLQLFDGTAQTIKPDIDSNSTATQIEKALGVDANTTVLGTNSESNPMNNDDWTNIVSGSSTVAGASRADLNQPLEVWLSNTSVADTQVADFSTFTGVKQTHLYAGAQDVAFNSAVNGNVADVTSVASGEKNITLGGGDVAIVAMPAEAEGGKVNITGGTGNDSVVVQNSAPVVVNMNGGNDKLVTMGDANARVTLDGYNATTGAAIVVQEEYAGDLANAVVEDNITFGDGVVIIGSSNDSTNASRVNIGESETSGWIVNLENPSNDVGKKTQVVGFTGSNGGTVDGSAFDDVLFVGNKDGNKSAGSNMIGGDGNDTFLGGAGDRIVTGKGKDLVDLSGDSSATRDGAAVNVTSGRVTIRGAHSNLGDFTGDTLSVDDLDITKMKFSFAGGSLIMKGENDSGESIYTVVEGVSTTGTGYVTQLIQNGEGQTYRAAIGAESSTMAVADDEEQRAYAYIGKNSAVDFSSYTKDAVIDLGEDSYDNYIDGNIAYFEGVNQLVGGEGDMVFKGGDGKETLTAGKGNTSMYGAGGLNVLNGYTGDDKEGSSTFFVIGGNDGAVSTINNFEYVGNNNFYYAANVTADQLNTDIQNNHFSNVAIVGNDLLLEVTSNTTGESEKALLVGAFDSVTGYGKDFAVNGLVAQVGKDVVDVDDIADYYLATGTNATVKVGSSITDEAYIWLDNDPDRLAHFEGDFTVIDARNSTVRAELAGNDADNTIYAGSGNTSLWGGNGGNDLLVGGTGTDNFYYAIGNGNDTIDSAGGNDNINLVNITLADLSIETITSSAVVLNFTDGGKLTVNDNNSGVSFKVGDATYQVNSSRTDFEQK